MLQRVTSKILKQGIASWSAARNFDLHEYQSKDIMRKYKITVQKGGIAQTPA